MMAFAGRIKSHLVRWREWELNPIVIKELRQAVRSWTVTGMLLLFLAVLFVTSLGFLVSQSFGVDANLGMGGSMFSAFMVILAGASIFFIPLYLGIRVALERQENNPDLFYISTLSPTRIILGKFLCGAYLVLLFFSACMPFMAFTNLLRGVDLPTVFFILAILFLVVCAANMAAIFLACLPTSRPFKFLLVLYAVIQSFGIIASLLGMSFMMLRAGVGAMMAERNFWISVATFLGIGLAATGLLFVLAVALITPPSANRALPTRLYLTSIWLLGGVVSVLWVVFTGHIQAVFAWTYPTFVVMVAALMVTISNSDQLSARVRRTIPPPGIRRMIAFIFYNGAAGGLIWAAAIFAATWFVTEQVIKIPLRTGALSPAVDDRHWFITMTAYVFCYALAGLLIHRTFLPKRPPKLASILAVLLAAGWAMVPGTLLFFLNRLSWSSLEHLQLGNMFNLFVIRDDGQRLYHEYFALGWLLLMLALSAKWFLRQAKNFRPEANSVPPPPPAGVPPVISSCS
jgi:hypothetical protein